MLLWSKNSRVCLRQNLVPTLEWLIDVPLTNQFFNNFHLGHLYSNPYTPLIIGESCLFCAFVQRTQHIVLCFISSYKEANLLHNYWPHFTQIIEYLLMLLLSILVDLTDDFDVFCWLLVCLILMSKRIHLIQKYVVFKEW